MNKSQIVNVYLEHAYNMRDRIGCGIRGNPVIFSEFQGVEKHYGNLEYAVQQALEKGVIRRDSGIICRTPDSKPHFQIHESYDNVFIRRTDLNDVERGIVEEIFSRYVFD